MRLPRLPVLVSALALAVVVAPAAAAAPGLRVGIQDDAWLSFGPGTLDERVGTLKRLNVEIVRYNLRWNRLATRRPARPRDHADPAYDWSVADQVLAKLRERGIPVVVGLQGTPAWANGGRAPNFAPGSKASFAAFAYAAAKRYPWVRRWLVWNEPNQARWLRPTTAKVYVARLLNPAYAALKQADARNRVGAGVTAPRGNRGGVSPVKWIRDMRAAKARFDAYAHHPYPLSRHETPTSGGCGRCNTITMATLDRLLRVVRTSFGGKRIWLTEWGYQTNPPDRLMGVSYAHQARYVGEAVRRASRAPRVDMLIQFLYRDEAVWQSGLVRANGAEKPSLAAFRRAAARY